jgi:hypothetical protein
MRGALRQRPFRKAKRIKQLRLALLIAGLPGDIAQELAVGAGISEAVWTDLGAVMPSRNLFVCYTNK